MVKEQFDFQHQISLITECLHTTDVLGWYKKMFSIDLAKKECRGNASFAKTFGGSVQWRPDWPL